MSRISDHKQHINVRSSQLEISPRGSSLPLSEDFTGKLQEAESQLELLQQQQAEVERQKQELKELNENKEEFLQGQIEINEKLNTAITAMDREIFATQQELEELQQTRTCFANHLEKIDQLNPDGWNNESLRQDLTRAISVLDLAEDEYEQAVDHFSEGRSSSVFGGGVTPKRIAASTGESELMIQFRNGFAFNFPLVLLGIIALIVFVLK
jgi:chromosome segregation ATPase